MFYFVSHALSCFLEPGSQVPMVSLSTNSCKGSIKLCSLWYYPMSFHVTIWGTAEWLIKLNFGEHFHTPVFHNIATNINHNALLLRRF